MKFDRLKQILLFFMLGLLLGGLFGMFAVSARPTAVHSTGAQFAGGRCVGLRSFGAGGFSGY